MSLNDNTVVIESRSGDRVEYLEIDGIIGSRFLFLSEQKSICAITNESCDTARLEELGLNQQGGFKIDLNNHLIVDFEFNTPCEATFVCRNFRYIEPKN